MPDKTLQLNLICKYLKKTEQGAHRTEVRIRSNGMIQVWSKLHPSEEFRMITSFKNADEFYNFIHTFGC
jgi:hypothetical protein